MSEFTEEEKAVAERIQKQMESIGFPRWSEERIRSAILGARRIKANGYVSPNIIRPFDVEARINTLETFIADPNFDNELRKNVETTVRMYKDGTLDGEGGPYYIFDGRMTRDRREIQPGVRYWLEVWY